MNFLSDAAIDPEEERLITHVNRDLSKISMVGRDGLESQGNPVNLG